MEAAPPPSNPGATSPRRFPWRAAFFGLIALLIGLILINQASGIGFAPSSVSQTGNWYQVQFQVSQAFPRFPTVATTHTKAAHTCTSGTQKVTSGSRNTYYLNASNPKSTVCGSSTLLTFYAHLTIETNATAAAGTYHLTFSGQYIPHGASTSVAYSVSLVLHWRTAFTAISTIDVYLAFGYASKVGALPVVLLVNCQIQ